MQCMKWLGKRSLRPLCPNGLLHQIFMAHLQKSAVPQASFQADTRSQRKHDKCDRIHKGGARNGQWSGGYRHVETNLPNPEFPYLPYPYPPTCAGSQTCAPATSNSLPRCGERLYPLFVTPAACFSVMR